MKFLTILTLAIPAVMAVAVPDPNPVAYPGKHDLVKRTTCTRKLRLRPDKHGVCVDTSIPTPQCTGGELYKADCGKLGGTWYCCII